MADILDGKQIRDRIALQLAERVKKLGLKPGLLIVQVGNRPDSDSYIRQKKLFAEKIGADLIHRQYPDSVPHDIIVHDIEAYNGGTMIHGIIVQVPLAPHLDKNSLIQHISPEKDVDGLHAENTQALWAEGKRGLMPATARGIVSLLKHYTIPISGKAVTVVGKSTLVGKPVALALMNRGATVTVCHKQTPDLRPFTRAADIIVVAAGHPGLITKDHVKPGQIVIDVGITVFEQEGKKKLVGDVAFDEVKNIVRAITPVPGGVGPMTVAALFENLVDACARQTGKTDI